MSYRQIAYDRGWIDGYFGYKAYCPYAWGTSEYYDYWIGFEDGDDDYWYF